MTPLRRLEVTVAGPGATEPQAGRIPVTTDSDSDGGGESKQVGPLYGPAGGPGPEFDYGKISRRTLLVASLRSGLIP